ncbi:rab-GTPase-TBC domain-containing protein, partial [Cristinia sonorae]
EKRWKIWFSYVPVSRARKDQDFKNLLGLPIPPSLQCRAWTYLSECQKIYVDGLYARLKEQGGETDAGMEKDAAVFVDNHPQIRATPIVVIVQAYLAMVQDAPYTPGLVSIAGFILLQSPASEEEAFWTFASIIETYIRPHLSEERSLWLDQNTARVVTHLDGNHPELSSRLFDVLEISPSLLLRTWFTHLFVDVLPFQHVLRIWDFTLLEGPDFLIRVAFTILQSCRTTLNGVTSKDTALAILLNPSPQLFAASPNRFIHEVSKVKIFEYDSEPDVDSDEG